METGVELFNKVMTSAMAIPGIKVDREEFLQKELRMFCNEEQLKKALLNPVGVISLETLNRIAKACISYQTTMVTTTSVVVSLPPGPFAPVGAVADLTQYYGHVLIIAQKLAYIYGYPDLRDEKGELSEAAMGVLTLFLGAMMGANAATKALSEISKRIAQEALKRIPQMALAKTFWYPVVKETAKWVGVKMTKSLAAKGANKIVPFIGAAVSGGLTYITFKKSAKRLQKTLKEQSTK